MGGLYPCPNCGRHVRAAELRCPFCGVVLDPGAAPRFRLPSERLSRAAQLAFTVTLGAHMVACSSSRGDGPRPAAPTAPVRNEPPTKVSGTAAKAPASTVEAAEPPSPGDAGAPRSDDPVHHRRVVAIYGATTIEITPNICFETGSAKLPRRFLPTVDAVAETLKEHALHVELRVPSDPGEGAAAARLARLRAEAVLAALLSAGAPGDRLAIRSGSDENAQRLARGSRPNLRCVSFDVVQDEADEGRQ